MIDGIRGEALELIHALDGLDGRKEDLFDIHRDISRSLLNAELHSWGKRELNVLQGLAIELRSHASTAVLSQDRKRGD